MQKDQEATIEIPVSLANKLMEDLRRLEVHLNLHRREEVSGAADGRTKRRPS